MQSLKRPGGEYCAFAMHDPGDIGIKSGGGGAGEWRSAPEGAGQPSNGPPDGPREAVTSIAAQELIVGMLSGMTLTLLSRAGEFPECACTVLDAVDHRIRLKWNPEFGSVPEPGTHVDIRFGISDGYYLMRGTLAGCDETALDCLLSIDMWRIQRRENFRVRVPPRVELSFRMVAPGLPRICADEGASVFDLSARGAKLVWPPAVSLPAVGERYDGVLSLNEKAQFALTATVRSVRRQSDGVHVGVEFVGITAQEEHRLTMICFDFERAQRDTR